MPKNPLAEVFGYPVDNMSEDAVNHRTGELCPFHNSSGMKCTKNSATEPLGVCTIFADDRFAITCPIRLRQDFKIIADAVDFFFPGIPFVPLTEVRLKDKNKKSAGNIDIVIAAVNDDNEVIDFGAVEVQTVYITGNVSRAFKEYMKDPSANHAMTWPQKNYPKPDYLSSSRKRLAPQLIYKGNILHDWGKKMAVAVHTEFYDQLPHLEEVDKAHAEIAWLLYDLVHDEINNRYVLERRAVKYTLFESALTTITTPLVGDVTDFLEDLSKRIKSGKIMGSPPPSPIPPEIEPLPDLFDNDMEDIPDDDEFDDE